MANLAKATLPRQAGKLKWRSAWLGAWFSIVITGHTGFQTYGAVGLPGIGAGWALEVLMLRDGQTQGPGQPAGYVWGSGEPFYGTSA
jgi:hypothetical protein